MASETEPAKLLLPYLQRADELQKHEPLVAYYCRLYAMERGLKIPQKDRTKMTNSILVSIIDQLEKDRKSLNLGPDDKLHVASSVFSKADKQDRADLNTAKTFYAASIFFEILSQFGDEQTDLEQKRKYAVWKAADIRKALKEGRKPVPGPPDNDPSVLSTTSSGEYDLELSRSSNSGRSDPTTSITPDSYLQPPHKPYPHQSSPHPLNNHPSISPESSFPTAPSYYQASPDASSYPQYQHVPEAVSTMRYEYDSTYQPLPEQISEAHKAARFAVGALAFDDVAVAVDFLTKSLDLLTKPSAGQ